MVYYINTEEEFKKTLSKNPGKCFVTIIEDIDSFKEEFDLYEYIESEYEININFMKKSYAWFESLTVIKTDNFEDLKINLNNSYIVYYINGDNK